MVLSDDTVFHMNNIKFSLIALLHTAWKHSTYFNFLTIHRTSWSLSQFKKNYLIFCQNTVEYYKNSYRASLTKDYNPKTVIYRLSINVETQQQTNQYSLSLFGNHTNV